MSTATELKPPAGKKEGSESSKDADIFQAWKARKESINPTSALKPPGLDMGAGGRRRSNLRDIAQMNSVRGIVGLRRMTLSMRAKSDISTDMLKPTVKKENTYKMTPDDGTEFSTAKVNKAVEGLLEEELSDLEYDHDIVSKLSLDLSDRIKDRVKELAFPRHKIAVNVMVGQAADQGMEVASRCVWDHKNDNSVCVSYRNKNLFVIALIFGVYYE